MVGLESMEFDDYALLWWDMLQVARAEKHQQPINTWVEMKEEMHKRFVPSHYTRELYKKLQELKQRLNQLMRANIAESEEQSMARFMNGFNYQIKKIVEFQPYASFVELVHQATKVECHVLEELKYINTKAFFANRPLSSNTGYCSSTSSSKHKRPSKSFNTICSKFPSIQESTSYKQCTSRIILRHTTHKVLQVWWPRTQVL